MTSAGMIKRVALGWPMAAALLVCACGSPRSGPAPEPEPTDSRRCKPPPGTTGSPTNLMEAIDLMDALPRPVTVDCFVESLDRPMRILASSSTFSAQPASKDSPRTFFISGRLIVSWVPAGDGSRVLEFSEERPLLRSVKAEIEMPIDDTITYANFEHINTDQGGTVCAGCHLNEIPDEELSTFGTFYQSESLRPATTETLHVDDVRRLWEACDRTEDERRCDIFDAMFTHGEVIDSDFPRSLPTIYD